MVSIVTGGINTGKTKKLLSIFQQTGKGDGFISQKKYNSEGIMIGYDLTCLSDNERLPFIRLKEKKPIDWIEVFEYRKFSFSVDGLNYANELIDSLMIHEENPIYIDEIGPVELEKKGFDQLLKKVLQYKKDIFMTVRDTCVQEAIKKYNIKEYTFINTR